MLDEYDNFFLGHNVNEPVAIEIPVKLRDIEQLGNFLAEIGFEVTYNGSDTGKILLDRREDDRDFHSILSPVLKPEDRKPYWEKMKKALKLYHDIMWKQKGELVEYTYPHLVDTKYLVTTEYNAPYRTDEKDREINMLFRQLERSEEVIKLDNKRGVFGLQMEEMGLFPKGHIFNGATIPDPYSVVTGRSTRFVRYASLNPGYALGYSYVHGSKSEMGYEYNYTPDRRNRLGFFFEYESDPNQMFFGNIGVEKGGYEQGGDTDSDNETPVNRFDNPCVAIYVVWSSVNKSAPYTYMYKMSEEDPRFQLLKEYMLPRNDRLTPQKDDRFKVWNYESGNNKTYVPVKNGDFDNIDAGIQQFNMKQQKLANQQQKIQEIEKIISDIVSELRGMLFYDLGEPNVSGAVLKNYTKYMGWIKDKQQLATDYEEKIKKILNKLNEIKTEIAGSDYLQQHEFKELSTAVDLISLKQNDLKLKQQKLLSVSKKFDESVKEDIDDYVRGYIDFTKADYEQLSFDVRKKILLKFKETVANITKKQLCANIINIYIYAGQAEKVELFDIMQDISKQAPRSFRKELKKYVESLGDQQDSDVLIELFRGDNLFERFRKKMQFLMGQIKMKQMAQMNQIANQQVISSENEG